MKTARVGTVRSRIFRTPRAFDGKFRVLPTSQSAAAARRCGCFGEPSFCCAKNGSIIRSRPVQKETSAARVGTVRSRIFRTLRAFDGKFRVLPTSQSEAAARRCGCYGEPSFCCAKSGSIIRSRPKHKQTSERMSVYVWWARVDSDHRS